MTRLADFMRSIAQDTYPEVPSDLHQSITAKMVPKVCEKLPKGFSVLDVGCGQGVAFVDFWVAGAGRIVGITTNPTDVRHAVQKPNPDMADIVSVAEIDMHDVGERFSPESFDLVWARHVLEHSIAPYFALHEFKRVLKPGGWLYCEQPAPGTSCRHETNNPNHYSVLTDLAWGSLIIRAGFELVETLQWNLQTQAGPDIYYSFICRKQQAQ